jgi:hypothetical protein
VHLQVKAGGVQVGDVVQLHDAVAGFSGGDRLRWFVVTAVVGRNVRVAGCSSTRTDGVPVPSSAMEAFDRDVWVLRPPVRTALADIETARNAGQLPSAYVDKVLFYVGEDMP